MTAVVAGVLLGLAGSVHCLGMCGPLALVSYRSSSRADERRPTSRPSSRAGDRRPELATAVAYHGSRILLYVLLGMVAGWAGGGIATAGWRNGIAIAAGVVLIAQSLGLMGWAMGAGPRRVFGSVTARLAALSRLLPPYAIARAVTLGALNGLLPCGLLYAALAAAVGLGGVVPAVTFMTAFGVGTLPAFAALLYSTRALSPRLQLRFRRAAPIAIALVGLMLIARGWIGREGHAHGDGPKAQESQSPKVHLTHPG